MARLEINEEWCKSCGLCLHFCPAKALAFAEHLNKKGYHPAKIVAPEKCSGCAICYVVCPDCCFVIYR